MSEPPSSLVLFRRVPSDVRRAALDQFALVLRDQVTAGREFECLITDDRELQRLNRQFRGKDEPTDVLSFPTADEEGAIGSLAVSWQRASAQAKEHGHPLELELHILMLHGVLHLLGMDHETDRGRMARVEAKWRQRFHLPDGLIEKSAPMMFALPLAIGIVLVLLALSSFVQLLYQESLRLRTRDVASLSFFKDTLEDRLGFETEEGASCFSLIKHTSMLLLGILYFIQLNGDYRWNWPGFLESFAFAWLSMAAVAYALPQLLYRRTRGEWLLPIAPGLRLMALTARPFVAILRFFQSLIELTDEQNGFEEPPTPEENIEALIDAGTEEGLIHEGDRKLIQSVVEFGDKMAREVMTPRPNIVAVSAESTLEQLRQLVINEQYSRIPVYEESIDQIVGFVHVRDMFELEEDERARRTVRDLMRPIRFVPETKPVHDLMREMQADGTHMVVVVDEYGNTAGLVTMEDLVEVIVGEIRDEHEPGSDVTEDGQGGYVVSGNFDLSRLNDMFEFRAREDIESTTVGGLVTEWLGHVPAPGEVVERDGIRVEVLASDELRVEQVRISRSSQAVTHE